MATAYDHPACVKSDSDTYRVKEAMDAIHEAMHQPEGIDPYDGNPMDSELLGAYNNAQSKERGAAYRREFYRLPTVDHRNAEPMCDFEIVSWQTKDAKGDMSPEEYVAHCLAVVNHHRLQNSSNQGA